jgi:DNA-binding SARP family transcriptional activator
VPVGSVEVEVRLLGAAQLVVESRLVDGPDWRRSRVRALLCLLALRRQVRREEAMLLLWPDLADAPARHNLRVTLNYLQGLLEPERRGREAPFYLRQDAEWLRLLDEPHVVVDADVFERGIARGDRLRAEGRLVLAIAAYDDAFALWRGGCLADVANEDWAQPSIARIANRAANARLASGSIRMALDDVPGAIDAAIGALEIDQWSEPAYRLTVAAHLARADRPAAHRAMKECRAMLNDLGVAPSDETLALERRLAGPQP